MLESTIQMERGSAEQLLLSLPDLHLVRPSPSRCPELRMATSQIGMEGQSKVSMTLSPTDYLETDRSTAITIAIQNASFGLQSFLSRGSSRWLVTWVSETVVVKCSSSMAAEQHWLPKAAFPLGQFADTYSCRSRGAQRAIGTRAFDALANSATTVAISSVSTIATPLSRTALTTCGMEAFVVGISSSSSG